MTQRKIKDKIPEVEFLEDRFSFIENEVLRTNLAIAFQYIIYSIAVEEESELPGPVSYSIYKNIIIYTASVVEGILHYFLKTQLDKNLIKPNVMPFKKKFTIIHGKPLYKIPDSNEAIVGATYTKTREKIEFNTKFQTIISAAKNAKFLGEKLYKEVEDLRQKRNRIHLAALNKVDDFYDKETVKKGFNTAKKVIDKVENILKQDQNTDKEEEK